MSDNLMTAEDVLHYAIRIEVGSQNFYKNAGEVLPAGKVKDLVDQLAEEEIGHERNLTKRLKICSSTRKLALNEAEFQGLVNIDPIVETSSEEQVLRIALQREIATKNLYAQISSITNLDENVFELFDDLYKQEYSHVQKIEYRLERLNRN